MSSPRLTAGLCTLGLLAGAVGAGSATAAEATTAAPATPSAFSQKALPSRAVVSTYPMPRTLPTGGSGPIAVDHSGNVWFNETVEEPVGGGESARHPGEIVRMNRAGEVTPVVQKARAGAFAVALDGAIWFSAGFGRVGRIGTDGSVSWFSVPEEEETSSGQAFRITIQDAIVVGREGDAWVDATRTAVAELGKGAASEHLIVRVMPTGEISEFPLPANGNTQERLAVGSEGNIWFTGSSAGRIGYVTPEGRVETLPTLGIYSDPNFLTAGPDGAIWFTMNEKGPVIARTTTTGALSGFRIGGEKEYVGEGPLVAGPDGRIWFSAEAGVVGRLDPATGRVSKIDLPNDRWAEDLAVGPEGEVWYSSVAEPPCLTGDAACGGGGYYNSGIIGRIAPAPLSVELVGAKPADAGRQVKVRVECLDGDVTSVCRGKLRIRAAGARGKRDFALGVDGGRTFTVALPKRARAKLQRTRRLAVRVEATLAGGQKASRRFPLRIAAAKKSS